MFPFATESGFPMLASVRPAISIVVPVYNARNFIRKTLNSILAQSFSDFELLCVNDGSTDDTLDILKEYAGKDARIKVFSQENGGGSSARNLALNYTTGKYLSFLDADDLLKPTMYEEMFQRAEETEADIVICRTEGFDTKTNAHIPMDWTLNEQYLIDDSLEVFDYTNFIDHAFNFCIGWSWDKLYRSSFVFKNNLRFQEIRRADDAYFAFISLIKAQRIAIVPSVLIKHRMNVSTSLSKTREKHFTCFFDAMLAMRAELQAMGIYSQVEKAFINWAAGYIIWHHSTMKSPQKEQLKHFLCTRVIPELGIDRHPPSFFEKRDILPKMLDFTWQNRLPRKPLVSVIVTGYNIAPFLTKALDSVVHQTYENLEIICIDDGSTDESLSLMESFAREDSRISVYGFTHNTPGGVAAAGNAGIFLAKGEYIAFCDGDDWLAYDAIEEYLKKAVESDADFVMGKAALFFQQTGKFAPHYEKWFWSQNCFYEKDLQKLKRNVYMMGSEPWKKFYKAEFLRKNKTAFFEGDFFFEDGPFHAMNVVKAQSIAFVPKILHFYRQRSGASTHKRDGRRLKLFTLNKLLRNWLTETGNLDDFRPCYLAKVMANIPFILEDTPTTMLLDAYQGFHDILSLFSLEDILAALHRANSKSDHAEIALAAAFDSDINFCKKVFELKSAKH